MSPCFRYSENSVRAYHVQGYCPVTDDYEHIRVMIEPNGKGHRNDSRTGFHPSSFTCPAAKKCGCPSLSSGPEECPLYRHAIENLL